MHTPRIAPSAVALLVVACLPSGRTQTTPTTILEVDLENKVQYHEDVGFDPSKFATDGGLTTVVRPKNFGKFVSIADIVAVNGQPAKGIALYNTRTVTLRSAPAPGEAIADTERNGVIEQMFEILRPDGTPVGTILSSGLAAGAAPPGSAAAVAQGNLAIFGGTGAFLGARGQVGQGPTTIADRMASMNEDPANRRRFGGGKVRIIISVIPMTRPEVVTTAAGPAIFHADFSPVNTAKPAKAGEVLIAMATGLGPTRPGVDPGQPFPAYPANPFQPVSAPVSITVNGQSTDVLNALGWPGLAGTYRVDFRVPAGTPPGTATIQLTVAWIPGSTAPVPIQ